MKLKKRQDYGLNGFCVTSIPKAPRSIRRRAQPKKADEDSQICAFELLASLARKLLQESESSASSNASGNDHGAIRKEAVKDGHHCESKPFKTKCLDQGSSEVSVVVSESASQNCDQKCSLNEFLLADDDGISERTSKIMDSSCTGKIGGDWKPAICKISSANGNIPCKVEGGSPNSGELHYNGMENRFERGLETRSLNMDKTCSPRDPTELCVRFPALINSDRPVKLQSCGDSLPYSSFSRQMNDIKLGGRDDDDNLVRSNKFSNKLKVYTRIGDRRIRKLLTSRYWKVAPKLKDFEISRADGGIKLPYRKRKTYYSQERCQHDSLYKRRKLYSRRSVETCDWGFSSESVTDYPEKSRKGDKRGSASMLQGAPSLLTSGMTSSGAGRQASLHSKDSNVKFSIKSFRVPEIFIEVSETATVGSLKRTVMDMVSAIFGGGIHVGVVLHGKKIRDDSRTLSQTGISSEDNLDSLCFTLEPSPVLAPPPLCSEDHPHLLPCNTPQLVTRSQTTPALDSGIPNDLPDPSPLNNLGDHLESNYEAITSNSDVLTDTTVPDSRALVPVPAMNFEALAVVPVSQKIRRSEIAQRRTRRPFFVSEVEALVQAVEQLGTGRWRDVKLRSFKHADHRTYVDLKDKWKTLVHTARISPQQRRGEPVPQELLDRVLAANAYWFQHQAKQQGKHHPGILKIEASDDRYGEPGIELVML